MTAQGAALRCKCLRPGYQRFADIYFCDRCVDFARRFCCHKNVSITYRGSTYENSWETRYLTFVAGIVRGDPRRLCQSAAPSSSHSATS